MPPEPLLGAWRGVYSMLWSRAGAYCRSGSYMHVGGGRVTGGGPRTGRRDVHAAAVRGVRRRKRSVLVADEPGRH